jgi:DnaJ-class molecular chaperone
MNAHEIAENLVLERECESCHGTGYIKIGSETYRCEECKASGQTMTEVGKKVMEFVWNHLRD